MPGSILNAWNVGIARSGSLLPIAQSLSRMASGFRAGHAGEQAC